MVSVNHIEIVMLEAKTAAGKKWRDLVLKIKNLVVRYMREEMEEASRLATEEKRQQKPWTDRWTDFDGEDIKIFSFH